MKILIVDDDELTLKVIDQTLSLEGYQTFQAKDASKALNILESEKINLIISDIMMPNVSGLGLLSLLKNFYFDKIPVILISSLNKDEIIDNSLGMGASYFLAKPIDSKELVQCVKNILHQHAPAK